MKIEKDTYQRVLKDVVIGKLHSKLDFLSNLEVFSSFRQSLSTEQELTVTELAQFMPVSYYFRARKVCRGERVLCQDDECRGGCWGCNACRYCSSPAQPYSCDLGVRRDILHCIGTV